MEVRITKLYAVNDERNDVDYGSDVALGRVSEQGAVMWLLGMFVRHENNYGNGLMVRDVSENFVDISSTAFRLPGDPTMYETYDLDTTGLHGWCYELSGTHEQLAMFKEMVLICIRSIAGNYPELTNDLIDKIASDALDRELAEMA